MQKKGWFIQTYHKREVYCIFIVIWVFQDQGGHKVWFCPACGNQDDGSPMVGCDDCDAWYHW